jgi:uncharacterized membrane protein
MNSAVYQREDQNSIKQNITSKSNCNQQPQSELIKVITQLQVTITDLKNELGNMKGTLEHTISLVQTQSNDAIKPQVEARELVDLYDTKLTQWETCKKMISNASKIAWPAIAKADFKDLISLR